MSIKQKNRFDLSNFIQDLMIVTISSLIYIQISPASAQQPKVSSFILWCQQRNSLPVDERESINLLLQLTKTKNCQTANDTLMTTTSIKLTSSNIGNLKLLASLLSGFTNLRSLNLADNHINDLKPLATFINLKSINLNENDIVDLSPLARLTQLESINVYDNQISDLKPLAKLKKLTFLGLSANKIRNIKPLSNLNNLKELRLCKNDIEDVKPIHDLTNLREINICGKSRLALGELGRHITPSINNSYGLYLRKHLFDSDMDLIAKRFKSGAYTSQSEHYSIRSIKGDNYVKTLLIAKDRKEKSYLGLVALGVANINGVSQRVSRSASCVSDRPNESQMPNIESQVLNNSLQCPKGWTETAPLRVI